MKFLFASISIEHFVRDFAMLLVRYAANTEDLVKQLRKTIRLSESESNETEAIYHVLIKKMPGILLLYR